jgi:hypothetical protein
VTETAPLVLLGASHTELLAYFDADGASNDPHEAINLWIDATRRTGHGSRNFDNYRLRLLLAHSASLAIRSAHGQKTHPRFVTESQFFVTTAGASNARRL